MVFTRFAVLHVHGVGRIRRHRVLRHRVAGGCSRGRCCRRRNRRMGLLLEEKQRLFTFNINIYFNIFLVCPLEIFNFFLFSVIRYLCLYPYISKWRDSKFRVFSMAKVGSKPGTLGDRPKPMTIRLDSGLFSDADVLW